jgi:hypothetical protein
MAWFVESGEVLRLQEALLSDAGSPASVLPRFPDVHPSLRAPSVVIRLRLQLPHGPYCREAYGVLVNKNCTIRSGESGEAVKAETSCQH